MSISQKIFVSQTVIWYSPSFFVIGPIHSSRECTKVIVRKEVKVSYSEYINQLCSKSELARAALVLTEHVHHIYPTTVETHQLPIMSNLINRCGKKYHAQSDWACNFSCYFCILQHLIGETLPWYTCNHAEVRIPFKNLLSFDRHFTNDSNFTLSGYYNCWGCWSFFLFGLYKINTEYPPRGNSIRQFLFWPSSLHVFYWLIM